MTMVIRELIRERQLAEQETVAEIAAIRKMLEQGESSGFSTKSRDEILTGIKEEMRR